MSEYQYYEFQAIDRPLTAAEMSELRSVSTRGRVTPTSFVNEYSWGDFRGPPALWMERYFDAFLYLANWGTHVLKLRLPPRLLSPATALAYLGSDSASVNVKSGQVILSFRSDDEYGGEWVDGEGQLSSLISVRAELARGPRRALYLGWLLRVQAGELLDDDVEPPVPPGLGQPSAALDSLADFLRIDRDLLHAAAQASPPLPELTIEREDLRRWVGGLPGEQKDDLITRLIVDSDHARVTELLQRFLSERRSAESDPVIRKRTVAQLLAAAKAYAKQRKQREAREQAAAREQREKEAAEARKQHLDSLVGHENRLWSEAETLVATSKAAGYDQAVQILIDLRDLDRRGAGGDFRRRIEALRQANGRRSAFISRLLKAGL